MNSEPLSLQETTYNQYPTEHLTEDGFYYKTVTNQEENINGVILKLRKWTNSASNVT
jgi:hypothetical protein